MEALSAGRYRIARELGRGGMASVYLAHDEELGRDVAVKYLAEHLSGDDAFRARFVREARLAGRLAHPNIVRVYDVGELEGRPFIVMEYVPGTSLDRAGLLSAAGAVDVGIQACAGLQHAHDAGLVHRDVKPANLLLRDDGVLKIADFGIARASESTRHTQAGTLLGTAAYLAPEQIAGGEASAGVAHGRSRRATRRAPRAQPGASVCRARRRTAARAGSGRRDPRGGETRRL